MTEIVLNFQGVGGAVVVGVRMSDVWSDIHCVSQDLRPDDDGGGGKQKDTNQNCAAQQNT